jgi:hypothetical protein
MASAFQDTNISDIPWDTLTRDQVVDIAENDDRDGARSAASARLTEIDTPPRLDVAEYNPRTDPGPERKEDVEAASHDDTPLSAEEVPLEASRRDDTTLLATDTVVVSDENELQIIQQ